MRKTIILQFLCITCIVAGVTFAGTHFLYLTNQPQPIQGGRIRPDITPQQAIEYIKTLPPVPTFTGSTTPQPDPVEDVSIDDMMKELLIDQQAHNAPQDYTQQLTKLCIGYPNLCNIIATDDSLSAQQKYNYTLMTIYSMGKLAEFGLDPYLSLQQVSINNFSAARRGYANATLMVININQIATHKEFLQILAHELGHVIDLGVIIGTSNQINRDYTEFGKAKFPIDDHSLAFYAISRSNENTMRSWMTNQDFVSGYAMTNPFEDFAESHNMYLYHRDVFAKLAESNRTLKQKYDFFANAYRENYLFVNINPIDITTLSSTKRPWDTTRM